MVTMGFYGFLILVCRFPSFTAAFHWTRSRCSLNETLTSRRLLSTIIIFFAATTSATSHENWWKKSWSLGSFSWFFPGFFLVVKSHHLLFDVALFQVLFRQINEVLRGLRGLAPSRSLLIQKWGYGPYGTHSFHELFVGSYIYIYTYLVHGISVVLNHGIYLNNS